MVAAALAGCAVERGNRTPQQPGAAGGQAPGVMPSRGSAPGPMHSVFNRVEDTVAIGVRRMTVQVMLVPEMDRTAQRASMHRVLDAARGADSALAAVRVLGFFPPAASPGGHPGGMSMIPSAILEWVPVGGWNAVSAANARGPHTMDSLFVGDLPNHQKTPGAGTGR